MESSGHKESLSSSFLDQFKTNGPRVPQLRNEKEGKLIFLVGRALQKRMYWEN
jgi:hypothetical protein